ncbi:MAG: alpha/beta hydrolase [Chloroflexi bacterium]|nr:alpha/beta hydrolase [Chloroflexota bacterium]
MAGSSEISVQGNRIREQVIGAGPPVLMAHGWGASIELLRPLALPLSRQGYQCLMVDLPGFGESDEPATAFSIRDYAAFCIDYMNQRELPSVNYFGHSLGGRIGLILAAEHPDRIETLALSNSAGIREKPALLARMRLQLYNKFRHGLEVIGAEAAAARLRRIYNNRYGSADYQSASPIMRQTLIKVVNEDLLACAARVSAPTILIWGDADQATPLWMGRKLEETIPDAALIVHEGAGHYAYLDFPDKTAAIIDALIRNA